ncbi:DUF1800 domain-containing protein [Thetidibacter halocola]|uniref:DUF1800 domain-containing protein n=1 Tax=Thetidibacter halocola TaxID=2827239 RepID=A0A8J8B7M9_9RHOB|nr:DUF1800 domain-containing protein [Thetidibacter halocola]MBS0123874.1 DUF1800 domain-containing protein [Thetidibacter halocola]
MPFDPQLAEMRFGCGLSPGVAPPDSVAAMLAGLSAPDSMAARFPVASFAALLPRIAEERALQKRRREVSGTSAEKEARQAIKAARLALNTVAAQALTAHMLRRAHSDTPLRERLEDFWADHFTAQGKEAALRAAGPAYVEEAIRPNVAGRFEDLLIAAATHPLMVHYLDQNRSFGPGSKAARGRGLNENLAREILELHTLGVGGPYTQDDVRQLAELLTGLSFNVEAGRVFLPRRAEPGAETVLGRAYGGAQPGLGDIEAVLRDLGRHPATARHITRKLAVHFVSETPDAALLTSMEEAWLSTEGDLQAVLAALLDHPAAWAGVGRVKRPALFMASACRALALPGTALEGRKPPAVARLFARPMALMGQVWLRPPGPDGFPDADSAWITPQGVATRLQWALTVPQRLVGDLPDPRAFVDTALGGRATGAVRFAAGAAESRADGIGLVLASPAFQRM